MNQLNARKYRLCLFVTGAGPQSVAAIMNVKSALGTGLRGSYDLEIFDVYRSTELAREEKVLPLPTLVIKEGNLELKRLIGHQLCPKELRAEMSRMEGLEMHDQQAQQN